MPCEGDWGTARTIIGLHRASREGLPHSKRADSPGPSFSASLTNIQVKQFSSVRERSFSKPSIPPGQRFCKAARRSTAEEPRTPFVRRIDPCQNTPSRTNLSPAERTNSFIFEITLKLLRERAVSSLTNRRISLSNKSSSTS